MTTTTVRDRHAASPTEPAASGAPLDFARLARWSLYLYVAMYTVRATVDPDLFWHLRTGERIVEQGIPRTDVFSFTRPDNEWITHEWLTQVLGWGAYSAGGFVGVSLLFALVGVAVIAFTYRTIQGGPILKVALTAATMQVATIAFGSRPQLFTLAFAAGFVWLVERVRRGDADPSTLWWAVPAAVLWANLHSGFVLGTVILLTYAVGDAVQRRFVRADTPEVLTAPVAAKLAKIAGLTFVVAVLNPSGPKLWWYPFETLRSEQMRELIAEWHSPDFHMAPTRPFLLMIVLGAVIFAASKLRPTVTDLLLFAGTVAAGLTSIRHIALAGVVAMPVLARHLRSATADTRLGPWLDGRRDRQFAVAPLFAGVVAVVLAAAGALVVADTLAGNDEAIEKHYPAAAIDWVEGQDFAGTNGYNSYGWGGYHIWRGLEVFSDGRADVYGDDFLEVIGDLSSVERDWEATLAGYDVGWALLPVDDDIVAAMEADADWTVVYDDDVAVVIRHE